MCLGGGWIGSQLIPTFNHYDSNLKNILDPTGAWGKGGKGSIINVLGDTKEQVKKNDIETAAEQKKIDDAAKIIDPFAERKNYTGDTSEATEAMFPSFSKIGGDEQARKRLLKSQEESQGFKIAGKVQ